jgi:hypothetical protein
MDTDDKHNLVDRGLAYHSELTHRGHKITVYTIPVAVRGSARFGTREAYTSIIDDSLNPDLDLEDAPRDTPEETVANAKEFIDSYIDEEVNDVANGDSENTE